MENIVSINKNFKEEKIMLLIYISLFIFPQELRNSFGSIIYRINFIGVFCILLLVLKNNNTSVIYKKSLWLLGIVSYLITTFLYEEKITTILIVSLTMLVPLLLTLIDLRKEEVFKNTFKSLLKILNFIVIAITIIGALEIIFNININMYISKFMGDRIREQIIGNSMSISGKRLYSYLGHPLYNTEIYIIYLVLNILYNKYFDKNNTNIFVLLISTIGICLTSSKTGSILLFITIVFLYKFDNRLKKVLIISIGALVFFKLGLFNNLISRFNSGSLTTGRNEVWESINNLGYTSMNLFCGHGKDSVFALNEKFPWASAAFEYPLRAFSFEMGIMMTIYIYIFIFLFPVIKLIKRSQYVILFSFMVVFVDVNTFNGIITSGDRMIVLCLFIFFVNNLSNYVVKCRRLKRKELNQYDKYNSSSI